MCMVQWKNMEPFFTTVLCGVPEIRILVASEIQDEEDTHALVHLFPHLLTCWLN